MRDDLTGPERHAENVQTIARRRGCVVCTNCAFTFEGKGYCSDPKLTYPHCLKGKGAVQFDPDPQALKRVTT